MSRPVFRLFSIGAAFAFLLPVLCTAANAQQSRRHLVFEFTVGISNNSTEQTAIGSGSTWRGANSYNANASDKGEIAVDIQGMQADGGLLVSASETAKTRTSTGTTCAIYASTNVSCADANTNPEIISVLRTLSPKFFNGANLDANRHWQVADASAGIKIDFTVTPDATGMLEIASQRDQTYKGAQAGSVHATASYVYNPAKYVPTSLKEYTVVRQETSPGAFSNTTVDVTARLASDSAGS